MYLSNNIRFLRQRHGISQDALAEKLGYKSFTTIQKWETGISEPPVKVVKQLSEMFNVKFSDLVEKNIDDSFFNVSEIENAPVLDGAKRIPILGRIAAGLPLYAEQNVEGYTYTTLNGGAEYFALRVQGDSMNKSRIYDGDTLIVRKQSEVENGQIAVVMVGDDSATVKKFYQADNIVTLMPQSTNPIHQPQVYDTEKTDVRIVGLVVQNQIAF